MKTTARVKVTEKIISIGQTLAKTISAERLFRKLPWTIIRKCLSGFASATSCNIYGIFSTGVAKPERSINGTIMEKVPRIACCWVLQMEEIIRPIPTTEMMNITRLIVRLVIITTVIIL